MKQRRLLSLLLGLLLVGLSPLSAQSAPPDSLPTTSTPIQHFILLMQENHSFDNYFGTYPGANGVPPGTCMPVDPFDSQNTDCVEPYHIGNLPIEDLDHSLPTFKLQYNNGRMDGFVYALNRRNQHGENAMGYYDGRDLPYYWNIADEYVLFDNLFTSAKGGSAINHMYSVAGAPGSENGRVPPEGFGDVPTIFDRLQEKGISWKFYVQNYDPNITYRATTRGFQGLGDRASQVVWVPLLSYDRYLDDPELFSHIVDLDEYYTDLENGTLPAVAYIVPSGASEHPPGSIRAGQKFVRSLIQALMRSEYWSSSAFMWAYDDWGGWYDHVPPPQVDKYGYGLRAPALLVSAYARRGYIDSTQLDFTSMLKFIEENWGLEPLAERDAKANSIKNAFDFSQAPRPPVIILATRDDGQSKTEPRRSVIYIAYGAAIVFATGMLTWAAVGEKVQRKRAALSVSQSGDIEF